GYQEFAAYKDGFLFPIQIVNCGTFVVGESWQQLWFIQNIK
ncbi:hypothetical protein C5167_048906, partial [Papaver somniferum]